MYKSTILLIHDFVMVLLQIFISQFSCLVDLTLLIKVLNITKYVALHAAAAYRVDPGFK